MRKLLSKSTLFYALLLVSVLANPAVQALEEVFVFPEAHHAPVLRFIKRAKYTIDMSAYKFTDETLIKALRTAADRGVKVNLLMEKDNIYKRPDESPDATPDPAKALEHTNISVFRTSPRFNQSHYKMILVDEKEALVSTGNFCPDTFDERFPESYRDFMLLTDETSTVGAILKGFRADTEGRRVILDHPQVVWGPDQTRGAFLKLINGAQRSLDIYQQDIQDEGLARALAGAARAGVEVRLLMNPFPFGGDTDPNVPNQTVMSEAGAKVRLCEKGYRVMHAKTVIVDGHEMYLGSCNFYTSSVDQTRELGILTHDRQSISTVRKTFEKDWGQGTLFVSPPK